MTTTATATARTRINAKGRTIPSNYGVTRHSASHYTCNGCGREFTARSRYAHREGGGADSAIKASAHSHADRCVG